MEPNSLPPFIEEAFEAVNEIPMPSSATVNTARRAFLAEARHLRAERAAHHRGISNVPWLSGKEKPTMMASARTLIAILLLAGATTGASFAADASAPDGVLYPVDLAMEQAQLALTHNVQTRAELHLRLAAERADELVALAQSGNPPDQAALERLHTELQLSLQTASQLQEQAMVQTLTQFQQMIAVRQQQMAQLGLTDGLALMERARVQAQAGLDDPAGFQTQYRNGTGWADDDPGPESDFIGEPARQQNQIREQTQTCDPAGEGCEPVRDQEQLQEQSRDQQQACDPTTSPCDPVQEQQQTQQRQQSQECDPALESCDQEQTREQSQEQSGQPESPGNGSGGSEGGNPGGGGKP